jgi:hypothetical protein
MSSSQLAEGMKHLEEAEKSMKTGFFKRTPDYDTACDAYDKAGLRSMTNIEEKSTHESLIIVFFFNS